MSLKVEIVQPNKIHPAFIIIQKKEIYPIVDFFFRGETEEEVINMSLFHIKKGVLYFLDIFSQEHYIAKTSEEYSIEQDVELKWSNRVKALDKDQYHPLKNIPPWEWDKIPKSDWPTWMN